MPHNEAPFSANVKVISPNGYPWMLTVRQESAEEFVAQLERTENWLIRKEWAPDLWRKPANKKQLELQQASREASGEAEQDETWCPIHQASMTRREKHGEVWYSHKAGDVWCNGKPPKK
jgi:hypothetical protein